MLVAAGAKSVQVPLHTWIPEAMAAPTPVSALLHAACYVKAGVYLAARMHSFGVWPAAWGSTLVWIGTVTMAVGVMYAMVQTDLKRMLAFSTVSQIGYMMMGIGIGTPLPSPPACCIASITDSSRAALFDRRLGAARRRHARHEQAGRPGAEDAADHALLADRRGQHDGHSADERLCQQVDALCGSVAGWLGGSSNGCLGRKPGTVFLCAKATSAVFLGPLTEAPETAHESRDDGLGMGFMAAGSIVLGVAPQLAVNYLLNPVLGALRLATVQVTWFGLSAEQAASHRGRFGAGRMFRWSWAALFSHRLRRSYAAGCSHGWRRRCAGWRWHLHRRRALSDQGRLTAGDFSEIFLQNWHEFFKWSNVDRVFLAYGADASGLTLAW